MRAVMVETESRSVEDAAFGDGGMERAQSRLGLRGFATTLRSVPIAAAPPVAPIISAGPPSVYVNGSPIEGHVYMTIGGQHFQSGSGLTPAEPGTTGWVIEQKLLHQMIAQRFLPATVKTIADLPVGSTMTKHEGEGNDIVTYEVTIPGGGTFRCQFSQVALQMMKVGK